MSALTPTGYVTPEGFHLWWRLNQPYEIHLVSSDPTFNSLDGQHPGLWVTFSANPGSANWHPQNFNRAARALAAQGLPYPPPTPEHDRRLSHRAKWVAVWKKSVGPIR